MSAAWEKFKLCFINYSAVAANAALEYDTPKIVHIKNKTVGVINRLVQLGIIGYIVGFAIVYEKGYQKTEDVVSSVTIKVQGLGYTNGTGLFENAGDRVWDSADYVIPPQSPNSVFIMTNMWITNQIEDICPEPHYSCTNDSQCENGLNTGNGILNGSCSTNGFCFARAWCPIEQEDKSVTNATAKLLQAVNFTIFIKNTVQFPSLKPHFRRRNIHDTTDQNISACRFNFDENIYCPVFPLRTIIGMLERPTTFDKLAINGAVLGLQIEWLCDLDHDDSKCKPRYSARRLDDPYAKTSPGFNFRFANNNWRYSNGTNARELIKAYGIRVNVLVTGKGGKFDLATLILKLGSGIALLAVATLVSDIVILYVLRERGYYRKKKYLSVTGKATLFKGNLPFGDHQRLASLTNEDESHSEFEESEQVDSSDKTDQQSQT